MALRHHCREGDLKWVSLLLWAGADPFAKGPDSYDEDPDPEDQLCALEYAALYGNFDIFKLKKVHVPPNHPIAIELLRDACRAKTADFLIELLNQGFNPAEQKDHGSSLIQTCIESLSWSFDIDWLFEHRKKDIDSSSCREKLKMIHMLGKHGAKWMPSDSSVFNDARRSLLKMRVDYTVEFVWIISRYQACSREDIEQLLRTPAIKKHIVKYQARINELLEDLTDQDSPP